MIERIATVPGTPLLIPEVASGAADELDDLRAAVIEAVSWAGEGTGSIIVLAQDPSISRSRVRSVDADIDLSSLGVLPSTSRAFDSSDEHPCVAAIVGQWLAQQAGVQVDQMWLMPADPADVRGDALPAAAATPHGVVLIADGSSTRTPKAPGAFVAGSVEFDDDIVAALGSVDSDFFTDPQRTEDCHRYQVGGLGPWYLASAFVAADDRPWVGDVDLTCDPYGVEYVVARWSRLP